MKWATRAGCHVDRAGCVWLIRRFVDPSARFVFVDDADDVRLGRRGRRGSRTGQALPVATAEGTPEN